MTLQCPSTDIWDGGLLPNNYLLVTFNNASDYGANRQLSDQTK